MLQLISPPTHPATIGIDVDPQMWINLYTVLYQVVRLKKSKDMQETFWVKSKTTLHDYILKTWPKAYSEQRSQGIPEQWNST